MSRIYFHSEHGTAELQGSERYYMGSVCNAAMFHAFGLIDTPLVSTEPHWLAACFPSTHYVHTLLGTPQARMMRTALSANGDLVLKSHAGITSSVFAIGLNTAYRVGSDQVKLMARLHGQCELHTWVAGPNRAWLADIIEHGREINLYRPDVGWESVAELLRSRDDCPVVTSYSVTESFPNQRLAREGGWQPEGDADDAWAELDDDAAWHYALVGLRSREKKTFRELRPDAWADFFFSNGMSAYDMVAAMHEKAVAQ